MTKPVVVDLVANTVYLLFMFAQDYRESTDTLPTVLVVPGSGRVGSFFFFTSFGYP